MKIEDLRDKLVAREDEENVFLDFRLFGNRQSEAMDCYLQEAIETFRGRGMVVGSAKAIVLICDPSALLTENARFCLCQLQTSGESIGLKSTPPAI